MKNLETDGRPVYLSASEAARFIGLHGSAISHAYSKGKIPAAAFIKGQTKNGANLTPLFTEEAVREYGAASRPASERQRLRDENERLRAELEALKTQQASE